MCNNEQKKKGRVGNRDGIKSKTQTILQYTKYVGRTAQEKRERKNVTENERKKKNMKGKNDEVRFI